MVLIGELGRKGRCRKRRCDTVGGGADGRRWRGESGWGVEREGERGMGEWGEKGSVAGGVRKGDRESDRWVPLWVIGIE